jgi:hypothetical protein
MNHTVYRYLQLLILVSITFQFPVTTAIAYKCDQIEYEVRTSFNNELGEGSVEIIITDSKGFTDFKFFLVKDDIEIIRFDPTLQKISDLRAGKYSCSIIYGNSCVTNLVFEIGG